jgi:hypothetical protein
MWGKYQEGGCSGNGGPMPEVRAKGKTWISKSPDQKVLIRHKEYIAQLWFIWGKEAPPHL